jgi:thioredoxin-related protein
MIMYNLRYNTKNSLCKVCSLFLCSVFLILTGCTQQDPVDRLRTVYIETNDYDEAITYASALDKLVLISITGSNWCENSREMEVRMKDRSYRNNVRGKVINLNLDFVKGEDGKDFAIRNQTHVNRYGVTEVPTFILVNSTGEEINRVVGVVSTEELGNLVEGSYSENRTVMYAASNENSSNSNVSKASTIERAVEVAGDRKILVEFTGSDWCPPCMRMKEEVLSTRAFRDYANENLVHVYLDFPRRTRLDPEVVEYNNKTAKEYKVGGYPTYIIMDSTGKELKRTTGYMVGGPERFIDWIK